jgi:hypothetical protein
VDLDLDGLTLRRAVAVPAFPLVANGRFAPTALERPRPAIAEGPIRLLFSWPF